MLILGTNRLTFHRQSWIRAGMAAAVGGIHAGMCLIPEFLFLSSNLWRFVFLGLVAGLAFGFDENPLRQITVFLLLPNIKQQAKSDANTALKAAE